MLTHGKVYRKLGDGVKNKIYTLAIPFIFWNKTMLGTNVTVF